MRGLAIPYPFSRQRWGQASAVCSTPSASLACVHQSRGTVCQVLICSFSYSITQWVTALGIPSPEGARASRPRINGAAGQRTTPTSVLLCWRQSPRRTRQELPTAVLFLPTLHSPKVPSRPKKAGAEPLADTGEVCGWQTRDRETLPSRTAKRDGGERPAQLARARTQYRSKGSELWQKMRAVRWRAGVRSYFSAVLRSQPILFHAGCPIAPPATTSRC